jgi:hypothetical protein
MLQAPHGRETEFAPPRGQARPLGLVASMPPLKAPKLFAQR